MKTTAPTQKYFRFRLADMQSFGEVDVAAWATKDCAYVSDYGYIEAAELFDSESAALEAAVNKLRDDEEDIYRQRREFMKRLDEIDALKD